MCREAGTVRAGIGYVTELDEVTRWGHDGGAARVTAGEENGNDEGQQKGQEQ